MERESDIYFKDNCITTIVTQEFKDKHDDLLNSYLTVGQAFSYLLPATSPNEAFERLKKWSGQKYFEDLKQNFLENNDEVTIDLLIGELEPLKDFIRKAKSETTTEAFNGFFKFTRTRDNHYHEYLRINEGFYKNHECLYALGETAALVYGKYFLYKKWLEDQLKKLQDLPVTKNTKESYQFKETNNLNVTEQHKLDLKQKKELASKYLNLFSGYNSQNAKIMPANDYFILESLTYYLIENNSIPKEFKKIKQLNISNEFIRYTYYQLHKELFGSKRINEVWIYFLLEVFDQFKNSSFNTTKTKFSVKPSLYETDINKMKR